MDTTPYWTEDRHPRTYPSLEEDLNVDVLIVGGGITGATAAYLLAGEGQSVALVERSRIAAGETSHTTAHLTYMTDTRLSELVDSFGKESARHAWLAGAAAMEEIRITVEREGIDCALQIASGFLAAAEDADIEDERATLKNEAEMAMEMGFDVELIDADPVTSRPALHFPNQLKFHPLRYVDALVKLAAERGVHVFENTNVSDFSRQGIAHAGRHRIHFKHGFIATHVPLQGEAGPLGAALFQTKLAAYSTYAMRVEIDDSSPITDLIWSDTADPFTYLRFHREGGRLSAIAGGDDHKTGLGDPTDCYRRLEDRIRKWFPSSQVTRRWSGQVIETVDGLPFIGPVNDEQFIATGFSGNGITFGTVSALMFRQWLRGGTSPYTELFAPSRRTPSAWKEYLGENKDYPIRFIRDRLGNCKTDPAILMPGHAAVFHHDGKRIAAFRGPSGKLLLCNAVCPHLGCIVAWNEAEQTWDCPCHGSRFQKNGTLLAGPAEKDLETI